MAGFHFGFGFWCDIHSCKHAVDIKLSNINKNAMKAWKIGFLCTNVVIIYLPTGFEYLNPEYLILEDYLHKLKAWNLEYSNLFAKIILKI